MKPWRICCVVSRSQARAVAQFRRGVLAADGSLLERGPFPKAAARYCGAKPAKHHGPALQLRLGAEKQQPGGLKLKNTPDKLTHVWWDPDQESVLYLWGNGEEKVKMNNVRAVLLVHSRWIYIIYEELIQTRKFANMCVLLFVRCLFVYKLYSLLAL